MKHTDKNANLVLKRFLLSCGIVAGPLFIVAAAVQELTRPGFDYRHNAISMLSLGDLGWIQIANFIITGLLAAAFAIGLRRTLHPGWAGTWGPILIGAYGAGLIAAGFFTPDPSFGYPPGAPAGMPDQFSWHAILHSVAFFVAMPSLIAACFVFARRFSSLGQRGWMAYSAATGLLSIALVVVGTANQGGAAVLTYDIAATLTSAWISIIAAKLTNEQLPRGAKEALQTV